MTDLNEQQYRIENSKFGDFYNTIRKLKKKIKYYKILMILEALGWDTSDFRQAEQERQTIRNPGKMEESL